MSNITVEGNCITYHVGKMPCPSCGQPRTSLGDSVVEGIPCPHCGHTLDLDEDDSDDVCRFPGCEESLDDGEGYDGWCGDHADKMEAHSSGRHGESGSCVLTEDDMETEDDCTTHDHAEGPDDECPVCEGHTSGFGD